MKYIRELLKILLSIIKIICIAIFGIISILVGFLFSAIVIWWHWPDSSEKSLNGVRCLKIEDEFQYFYEDSGFKMPSNAKIILSCDDHSGFHWDGEYYVVFETTAKDIANYLNTPPWDAEWQKGPVPNYISNNSGLSEKFENTFNSSRIWYVAFNHGENFLAQHNNTLMIIDPESNLVFYSDWDF